MPRHRAPVDRPEGGNEDVGGGVMTENIAFTLNGEAVVGRAGHPHLPAVLRGEPDVTSPEDG